MTSADLPEADRIFRLAFATYLELDPEVFENGREAVRGRFATDPNGAIVALDGETIIGSNIITNWGSFGFFGPLTVDPAYWGKGVAKQLMQETLARFASWGTRHAALFTFADSAQHQSLYQRYGFWPRFLTAIMHKIPVTAAVQSAKRHSQLTPQQQSRALVSALDLANAVSDGMDLTREISSIALHSLGDTVMVWLGERLDGIALCHFGKGSEAAGASCYVKLALVRPGPKAETTFDELLDACETLAVEEGLTDVEAGANTESVVSFKALIRHGYTPKNYGVFMLRGGGSALYRPDDYSIADFR